MLNVLNVIGRSAVRAGKTDVMRAVKCSIEIRGSEHSAVTQANCAAGNVDKSDARNAVKKDALSNAKTAASATAKSAGQKTGKSGALSVARNAETNGA